MFFSLLSFRHCYTAPLSGRIAVQCKRKYHSHFYLMLQMFHFFLMESLSFGRVAYYVPLQVLNRFFYLSLSSVYTLGYLASLKCARIPTSSQMHLKTCRNERITRIEHL